MKSKSAAKAKSATNLRHLALESIRGNVTVHRGSSSSHPGLVGASLSVRAGDLVRTARDATVRIASPAGFVVDLAPASVVEVLSDTRFRLRYGYVRLFAKAAEAMARSRKALELVLPDAKLRMPMPGAGSDTAQDVYAGISWDEREYNERLAGRGFPEAPARDLLLRRTFLPQFAQVACVAGTAALLGGASGPTSLRAGDVVRYSGKATDFSPLSVAPTELHATRRALGFRVD